MSDLDLENVEKRLYWVLDGHTPKSVTRDEWMAYMLAARESADPDAAWEKGHRVALTKVGDSMVSTVFMNHNVAFTDEQDPIVFETMILGRSQQGGMRWQYTTWTQAIRGHNRIVKALRAGKEPR